ncbi:MAG: hypothetical protein EZS28_036619 [Streblomastix strix]|uniref:Uncharacterized protein n=1 Tax=Streblomastix strix TaxID=222440 RepID=A0A5J4UCA2_9EUKA|nr:MAG: hypothetical protein EZS28_036619 [Streblomastix strix]
MNEVASNLNKSSERLNQTSQQRGEKRREVGNQLLSSFHSETQQWFAITAPPYLTSGPPKMSIPIREELKIWRELPKELNDRTSGMMLKVGWSA